MVEEQPLSKFLIYIYIYHFFTAREKPTLTNNNGMYRSTFHDDLVGTKLWPSAYDGRAIITDSYKDHSSGLALQEIQAKFKAANDAGDTSRQMVWS